MGKFRRNAEKIAPIIALIIALTLSYALMDSLAIGTNGLAIAIDDGKISRWTYVYRVFVLLAFIYFTAQLIKLLDEQRYNSQGKVARNRILALEERIAEEEKERNKNASAYASDRLELATLTERALMTGAETRWANLIRLSSALVLLSLLASASLVAFYAFDTQPNISTKKWKGDAKKALAAARTDAVISLKWHGPLAPPTPSVSKQELDKVANAIEAVPVPPKRERDWRLLLAATSVSGLFLAAAGVLARLASGQSEQRQRSIERLSRYERMSFAVDFAERISPDDGARTLRTIVAELLSQPTASDENAEEQASQGSETAEVIPNYTLQSLGSSIKSIQTELQGLTKTISQLKSN